MLLRRLVRRSGGGIRVTLPTAERALLLDLAASLHDVVDGVGPDTPPTALTGRLFPRAYEDPLEEMEFAEAMLPQLAEAKRTLLDTFVATLRGGQVRADRWRTDLEEEGVTAWLAVLQDARLVLARAVGIESEADWERLAADDETSAVVLGYLGELLDGLVGLVAGGLPDPPEGA